MAKNVDGNSKGEKGKAMMKISLPRSSTPRLRLKLNGTSVSRSASRSMSAPRGSSVAYEASVSPASDERRATILQSPVEEKAAEKMEETPQEHKNASVTVVKTPEEKASEGQALSPKIVVEAPAKQEAPAKRKAPVA